MTLLYGFDSPAAYRDGFVSIGNFDGVHCGHQSMIAALVKRAREQRVPAVALTFDPHPVELLRPDAVPPRLTTISHRAELLQQYGVDCVIVLPTTPRFLTLTAEDFFHTIVRTELQARGLVEGPNFFFGRNRGGSITLLRGFCNAHHLSLDIIPPVIVDEQLVSSSVIRSLIEAGDLTESVRLLGHPYRLSGHCRPGRGTRPAELWGFPTANLTDLANLVPGNGVCMPQRRSSIQGSSFPAAVNVGPQPHFRRIAPEGRSPFARFQWRSVRNDAGSGFPGPHPRRPQVCIQGRITGPTATGRPNRPRHNARNSPCPIKL